MALSASAKLSLGLSASLSNPQNASSGLKKLSENFVFPFTNGNGAGQIQAEWDDERTINASSSENLDLSGALIDIFGNKIAFAAIKAIAIRANDGNTNNVLVGGAASNTFLFLGDATDIVPVKPGGLFVWIAPNTGAAVTAATGDLLKVANSGSGTTVKYKVYIMGTAALTPAS